ncbi:ion transporter [Devosia pacifica]|uniref:Ion transporter n=1 Tax=Devosia pacifica TaxID=1335967 RepID=A0A918RV19_9HYPH|nr:potassium channel family protein [Devosia pacifica]GHA11555.1 ion transporter [Devosia pacifica]
MNDHQHASEKHERHGNALQRLRARLRVLYHGHSREALRFQFAVLIVDLAIIAFFIATPLLRGEPAFLWFDYSVAALLALDLTARALATSDLMRWARQLPVIIDVFILLTLLMPTWLVNLGFLRILRLWTISRTGFIWRPLRKRNLSHLREPIQAVINLLVFLFVVTGFVYTFFARRDNSIEGYIDALYFTVATVTTTGFGDITLPGTWGKLTSIVVMIVGISLFVRLAQSIFRPNKVRFPCPQCGLQRHDQDAVHCKACGYLLNIPDDTD